MILMIELICPQPHERAHISPPGYFTVYKEHCRSSITFPPPISHRYTSVLEFDSGSGSPNILFVRLWHLDQCEIVQAWFRDLNCWGQVVHLLCKDTLIASKPTFIHRWKDCFFFVWSSSNPFRYTWTKQKSLSSPIVNPDEVLLLVVIF